MKRILAVGRISNGEITILTTRHRPFVKRLGGLRYPFRPACSCGWEHAVGYVAEHAAQSMADDHVLTVTT